MECNDILKVLNSILHGAELTSCGKDGTFWIDKWKKYSYQVNKAIANKIIDSNIAVQCLARTIKDKSSVAGSQRNIA